MVQGQPQIKAVQALQGLELVPEPLKELIAQVGQLHLHNLGQVLVFKDLTQAVLDLGTPSLQALRLQMAMGQALSLPCQQDKTVLQAQELLLEPQPKLLKAQLVLLVRELGLLQIQ